MDVELNGSSFSLLKEKAIYKPDEHLLLIADVHLGKAAHFRKEGIAIPGEAQQDDYRKLQELLQRVKPERVYFLGDLFHSTYNNDWDNFCNLIANFPQITFTLIKGNHDIIDHRLFHEICVEVTPLVSNTQFIYTHEPLDKVPEGKMNFAGHIHPGFRLYGSGRQSLMLPCFYVQQQKVILPAFGILTGLYGMDKLHDTAIYLVLPSGIKKYDY